MNEKKVKSDRCKHNEGVCCEYGNCSRCGWNPKEAAERSARILAEIRAREQEAASVGEAN